MVVLHARQAKDRRWRGSSPAQSVYQRRLGPNQRRDPRRWPANSQPQHFPTTRSRRLDPLDAAAESNPLARDQALARLEAVLFTADEPLSLRRLAALAQLGSSEACQAALARLHGLYDAEGAAFQIVEIAGGYQLLTRPDFFPWLARIRDARNAERLTGALLETLAIVAYRQPIMRAEIEAIRGVQSGDALRELMERGLVRIAGRDNSLGRPIIYGTTKRFLQAFGLRDLSDLPPMDSRDR